MNDIVAIIATASAGAVLFYMHVNMLRISPRRLRKVILELQPDYIFLTGDYTYSVSDFPKLGRYLRAIAG